MNVLFIASEGVPFVKTGGLADVIGSLPKELMDQGMDVRVILPKYKSIPAQFKENMQLKKALTIPIGWRNAYCGIEELAYDGVTYYFIDNEDYFNRPGLYGYWDEAERFVFFNRAVLEALPHLDFRPQVLHCHDWQTAMVSVFLKTHYQQNPFYQDMRSVFTIHNLKYQGIFPYEILDDLLHLSEEHFTMDGVEFFGQVSFMKGALNYSDALTTVSPTYAYEIQSSYYGERLDGLLQKRAIDLHGIINGIDYDSYNPMTDPHLFYPYRTSLQKKGKNKRKLQELIGLPVEEEKPMVAIVSRLVEQKGFDLVAYALPQILQLDIQLVVLGTGEYRYEQLFMDAARRFPEKVSTHITFDDSLARKIYASTDLFLMPSRFEPCGIGQLIALRYGAAPIVRETGGLRDTVQSYNEESGEGNGFSFAKYDANDMLFTLNRAIQAYNDKETWIKLTKNISKSNFSWQESAKKYQVLYESL